MRTGKGSDALPRRELTGLTVLRLAFGVLSTERESRRRTALFHHVSLRGQCPPGRTVVDTSLNSGRDDAWACVRIPTLEEQTTRCGGSAAEPRVVLIGVSCRFRIHLYEIVSSEHPLRLCQALATASRVVLHREIPKR